MPGKISGRRDPVETDQQPLIGPDSETRTSILKQWGVRLTSGRRHVQEKEQSVNRLSLLSSGFLRRSLSRFRSIQGTSRYAPNAGPVTEKDLSAMLNRYLQQHRDCSLEQLPGCEQDSLRDNLLLMLDWARSRESDYSFNEIAERAVTEFVSPIQKLAPNTTELMDRPPASLPSVVSSRSQGVKPPTLALSGESRLPVAVKPTVIMVPAEEKNQPLQINAELQPKKPLSKSSPLGKEPEVVTVKSRLLPETAQNPRKVRVLTSRERYYQATNRSAELLDRSPFDIAAQGCNYAEQASELRSHAAGLNKLLEAGSWIELQPDEAQRINLEDDIRHQQEQLKASAVHLDILHEGDFRNEDKWRRGHQVELESILLAISWEFDRLSKKPQPLSARKQTLVKNLQALQRDINQQITALPKLNPNGSREHMLRELKNYQKCMVQELKTSGMDKGTAKRLIEDARRVVVTELPWDVVHKTLPVSGDGKTVLVDVTQTPASKMRYINGPPGHHTPFAAGYTRKPYGGGAAIGGVSSMTRDEAYHAVNMWSMDVKDRDGKTLFQGVRSGTLCAYGIKNDSDRKEANRRRAREIMTAAVLQQFSRDPELARDAAAGKPVSIKLMSNALLSPDILRHMSRIHDDELSMLKEQVQAFEEVIAEKQPLILRDASGGIHPVQVNVDLATFNLGVNGLALGFGGMMGKLDGTWLQSNRYNRAGLTALIGNAVPDTNIGGWAGEWLKNNPDHPDADIVRQLVKQIRDIWASKAYQKEGSGASQLFSKISNLLSRKAHRRSHSETSELDKEIREIRDSKAYKKECSDAYKLVHRLLFLGWKIGAVPHWSCKSGKDRTGEAAASVAWLAAETELHGRVPDWELPMTRDQHTNAQGMLIEGGQMEITQDNIGRPLLKTGTGKKRYGKHVYKMARK
ncbi:inositol phosphate phosphatase SopB [Endozoicomonadaceae bacterium StTr2]